jgi:3-deoxy-D-manno-octulosonic-acid transferase
MHLLISIVYTLFLYFYFAAIRMVALWNPKAALWISGRKKVSTDWSHHDLKGCIWFHSSSLGEFEQINSLIQTIRRERPKQKILITFYSPSGYELKKDYPFADCITYLPFDFKSDCVGFIDTIQPSCVFWVRYEFWLNMLTELHRKNIPVILLNGVFRKKVSPFYLPFLKLSLAKFSTIFVINQNSKASLSSIGFESDILYDTRYDRMNELRNEHYQDEIIEHFKEDKKLIVFGSTWSHDESLIAQMNTLDAKYILVPHEVDREHIEVLLTKFPSAQTYSSYTTSITTTILIIDKIGLLSRLYRYGTINYVGGGFNKVVHSLIEPLAYGAPIIIGPNIEKSEEAIECVQKKLVDQITTKEDLYNKINEYLNSNPASENKRRREEFESRLGSTNNLMRLIKKNADF